ncbi:Uncharacterized protein Adt_21395 [Abeliophyllum distichum]|uniref:Uncharacterized protein n=2 Tax=Forsythieae TaxID=426104 RepID=A0ABD1SZA5_9LAMI
MSTPPRREEQPIQQEAFLCSLRKKKEIRPMKKKRKFMLLSEIYARTKEIKQHSISSPVCSEKVGSPILNIFFYENPTLSPPIEPPVDQIPHTPDCPSASWDSSCFPDTRSQSVEIRVEELLQSQSSSEELTQEC